MTSLGWSASSYYARARKSASFIAMPFLACALMCAALSLYARAQAPAKAAPAAGNDSVKAERRARRAAVYDLARSTVPGVGDRLAGFLNDEDAYTRGAAAESLGRSKAPGALAILSKAAGSGDEHTRWGAVDGLAEFGDRRAVPTLIGLLKHADEITRWKAAVALGRLGDGRAAAALEGARGDAHPPVRRAAAEALAKATGKPLRPAGPRTLKKPGDERH